MSRCDKNSINLRLVRVRELGPFRSVSQQIACGTGLKSCWIHCSSIRLRTNILILYCQKDDV